MPEELEAGLAEMEDWESPATGSLWHLPMCRVYFTPGLGHLYGPALSARGRSGGSVAGRSDNREGELSDTSEQLETPFRKEEPLVERLGRRHG